MLTRAKFEITSLLLFLREKNYSLVYASCFFQLVLFFYIGQIHTHFTVFTFDFPLPLSEFFSTVGIVFRISTQNPWQMRLHKSESEVPLFFLSLQTSSFDCSTDSTKQNATPKNLWVNLTPVCRYKPHRLTAIQTALNRMPHDKNLCIVLSPFCRYKPVQQTALHKIPRLKRTVF
jgi:hypothetical protein